MFFLKAFREKRCLACSSPFTPPVKLSPKDLARLGRSTHSSIKEEALAPVLRSQVFCSACAPDLLRRVKGYCPGCGKIAAWPLLPIYPCADCLKDKKLWGTFIFHNAYEGLLRKMLLDHKYKNNIINGYALGVLLGANPLLKKLSFDFILPIPLHNKRLVSRGYNQALELARGVAWVLKRTSALDHSALVRTKNNPPQVGLPLHERKKNVKNIFKVSQEVKGKSLLLVDDVCTTGSTLHEATKALLKAGAREVHILVAARASRD